MHLSRTSLGEELKTIIARSQSRENLWVDFAQSFGIQRMAEVGVYRGEFAKVLLRQCESLTCYYMIDPWQHLQDWNKPANHSDSVLESFFEETQAKTKFAAGKRVILRGRTVDVVDQICDGELDLAYIDADHTLKGISIDMIRLYPKVRAGGFLGGDDFTASIWEHNTQFEPTLVFPFAVYFAEAVGATIYALPYSQFCLKKNEEGERFQFIDLTGQYGEVALRYQVAPEKLLKIALRERFPRLMAVVTRTRGLFWR
jgi:hypothetical protein